MMSRHPAVVFCLVTWLAAAYAQSTCYSCPAGKTAGQMSVGGQGTVTSVPDTGTVVLSIQVQASTAAAAREGAAVTTTAVLAALGAISGINSTSDISTQDISLSPNYVWSSSTNSNTLQGYIFTQTLQVTVTNLTKLSSVVDGAVKAGGNKLQVQSVSTTLSQAKLQVATSQARALAVADALATAKGLAAAASVSMGPIISITDDSAAAPLPHPVVTPGGAAKVTTPTPVAIGLQTVSASVSMQLALCN